MSLCIGGYFEPLYTKVSEETLECNKVYKVYLLVSGICMIPVNLYILFVVSFSRRYSAESV